MKYAIYDTSIADACTYVYILPMLSEYCLFVLTPTSLTLSKEAELGGMCAFLRAIDTSRMAKIMSLIVQ